MHKMQVLIPFLTSQIYTVTFLENVQHTRKQGHIAIFKKKGEIKNCSSSKVQTPVDSLYKGGYRQKIATVPHRLHVSPQTSKPEAIPKHEKPVEL